MLRLWSAVPDAEPAAFKEIVTIIRPHQWQATKRRLQRLRLPAFTQQRVVGRGRERGLRYLPRANAAARTAVRYLPKRLISLIVEERQVAMVVQALLEVNRTGSIGDGAIFVMPIERVIRIRTGESGLEALRPEHAGDWVVGTLPGEPDLEHSDASRRESH